MTLRARLALGFVTIALLLVVPLAEALLALQRSRQAATDLRDNALTATLLLARARSATGRLREAEAGILVTRGDSASTHYLERQTAELATLTDSLRRFQLDSVVRTIQASVQEIRQYGPVEAAARHDSQDDLADRVSDQHVQPAIAAIDSRVADAEEQVRERARQQVDAAAAAAEKAWQLGGILLALALAAAAVVAMRITRSISRPVQDLERGMHAVAGGDFEHQLEISPDRGDEFGRLAASFTSMAQQLAELDKLKAEFVSVASHELKTPINVIMGYLKLLEENLYGDLNERQTQVIGVMQTQAQSMGRLVQHLLDVSRFEAGAGRLEARPMNLRGFLKQLESTYEVLAMQREVSFSVVASDTLPEVVEWDQDRVSEVLGNLLTNAFKFTQTGGRVDLVVTSLEQTVYVEVRDTGVGIAPAQLPHIFDKFFQADNQKSASAKGTGLGLAIAKEIVEAHHGSIAAESTVGRGTKFSIMLPISAIEKTDEESAEAAAAAPNGDDAEHESASAAEVGA